MTKTDEDRAKRLAAALRENLKRRKARDRAANRDGEDTAVGYERSD